MLQRLRFKARPARRGGARGQQPVRYGLGLLKATAVEDVAPAVAVGAALALEAVEGEGAERHLLQLDDESRFFLTRQQLRGVAKAHRTIFDREQARLRNTHR